MLTTIDENNREQQEIMLSEYESVMPQNVDTIEYSQINANLTKKPVTNQSLISLKPTGIGG